MPMISRIPESIMSTHQIQIPKRKRLILKLLQSYAKCVAPGDILSMVQVIFVSTFYIYPILQVQVIRMH